MKVVLVSTHRADENHYAALRRCLDADDRFAVGDWTPGQAERAVVLGDRAEMLFNAISWVGWRVPLLHIHGGEHTYGSLDERWRYAISAIADVHCVATQDAYDELKRRGCEHVTVTGAPGLDGIDQTKPLVGGARIMVAYNPALDAETTRHEAEAIQRALSGIGGVWWSTPNGDRFAGEIPWRGESSNGRFREMLAGAQVIVGNSSAGIIEAPSLGAWTVNVGGRQAGRVRAANVEDVPGEAAEIRAAVERALVSPRRVHTNPYGDGHASERIRDVLLAMGS